MQQNVYALCGAPAPHESSRCACCVVKSVYPDARCIYGGIVLTGGDWTRVNYHGARVVGKGPDARHAWENAAANVRAGAELPVYGEMPKKTLKAAPQLPLWGIDLHA